MNISIRVTSGPKSRSIISISSFGFSLCPPTDAVITDGHIGNAGVMVPHRTPGEIRFFTDRPLASNRWLNETSSAAGLARRRVSGYIDQ